MRGAAPTYAQDSATPPAVEAEPITAVPQPTAPPPLVDSTPALGDSSLIAPPPAEIVALPFVGSDEPVPYYSQFPPSDDIPQLNPLFELAPQEVKLGWISLIEGAYVKPFVHNGLTSGTLIPSPPGPVTTPTAQPNWTGMPRLDVGYRFEQGLGEFHAIYQTLNDQGSATVANFDAAGSGSVTTQLSLNVLDLDYAFTEFNPARIARITPLALIPGRLGLNLRPENEPFPMFRMKWAFGARIANVFFDSQGVGQQILHERVMNNFVGGGLHTSVDFSKPLPWRPSFAVYARFEGSGLFGDLTQSFTRTEVAGGGTITGTAIRRNVSIGVPVLDVEAGLSYMPIPCNGNVRITGGYKLQQWFYMDMLTSDQTISTTIISSAGVTLQGAFLRAEFGY